MTADTLILIGVIVAVLAAMALLRRGMPTSSASRFHCLGPTELQDPSSNCLVGDFKTMLGEECGSRDFATRPDWPKTGAVARH